MTDLRKAAEDLIKSFEQCTDDSDLFQDIERLGNNLEALRQALAQPDEVLAEREACAKLCEDICLKYSKADDYAERVASQWCAEAIRARSEKRPVKSYCGGKPNYCTPEQGNSSLNYHIAESNTPLDKIVEIAIQGHASTRDAIRWAMQQEREAIITWLVEDGFFIKDGPLSEQVREKLHHSIYFDVNRRKTPEVTPEVTGDVGACVTCGAPKGEWLVDAVNTSQERVDETAKREHEPFIYVREDNERPFGGYEHCSEADAGAFPVYTAPMIYTPRPNREWVGIDEKEVAWLWFWMGNREKINGYEFAKAIEAKLKERNGG